MNLRFLKTFVAVATELNFTKAARKVHLAQSTVTEQIQALETEFAAILLDRSNRQLRLTSAGQRLLAHAHDLIAAMEAVRADMADISGTAGGSLSIGALDTLCANWLPNLLADYASAYPSVQIRAETAPSQQLLSSLRDGEFDLVLLYGNHAAVDLDKEVVGRDSLVFVAHREHPMACFGSIAPAVVRDETFLVTPEGCTHRRIFEEAFAAADLPRPRLLGEFGSLPAILHLIEAGAGCAVLPLLSVPPHRDQLMIAAWQGGENSIPVTLYRARRPRRSSPAAAFIEAARARLRHSDQPLAAVNM